MKNKIPEKPESPCFCGSTEWWYMQSNYGSGWRCSKCHPNPKESVTKRGKGRPKLLIPLKLISDTLRDTHSIKETAYKLGCSRGYIYQELSLEKIKELIKE